MERQGKNKSSTKKKGPPDLLFHLYAEWYAAEVFLGDMKGRKQETAAGASSSGKILVRAGRVSGEEILRPHTLNQE